jgi:dipeptidyl aminopeptidase/acylaminoacyl peptidase
MKHKIIFISIIFSTLLFLVNFTQDDDFPVLKGPYLGQKPPGMNAEIFAPGIVSTSENEALYGFFKEGTFVLFDRTSPNLIEWIPTVYIMELKNGKWTKPRLSPFRGKYWYHNYTFAPEGKTVYFACKGSLDDRTSSNDINICIVKKTAEGWSESRMLEPPVNSDEIDTCPTVTKEGTLYFFSGRGGGFGNGDIYRSKLINGKHIEVENLGKPINTKSDDIDPFIAPDESYLIFCSKKPGGYGGYDFYISYQKQNGSWTEPINMGEGINSSNHEERPYVTSDGKYFFFTRYESDNLDIYWVDAKVIENLKPNKLK